ncbi:MAG: hypothetical protein WCT05_05615 [Lentisphaeria bacterium]
MKQKNIALLLFLGILSSFLMADDISAVWLEKQARWKETTYQFQRHAKLSNNKGYYQFSIVQTVPTDKSPARASYLISEPSIWAGFSGLLEALSFKVNGIDLKNIDFEPENFTEFKEEGLAGCSVKLDVDGTLLQLDWYMKDASPLLYGRIRHLDGEIQSLCMELSCGPSSYHFKPKGGVIFSGKYAREVVTPANSYKTSTKRQQLKPEDNWLVYFDESIPQDRRYVGACLFCLEMPKTSKVELLLRDNWVAYTYVFLKPDFKEFEFSLWESVTPHEQESVQGYAKTYWGK